ncbi:S-adenosyl-L-methionine-dependent methyltransferase [Balamuthia mandrillaris]
MTVFNRKAKQLQKDRAALSPDFEEYQYLRKEVGSRLTDRLHDMLDRKFPDVLELGCGGSSVVPYLESVPGVESVVRLNSSDIQLQQDPEPQASSKLKVHKVLGDEESLPFAKHSFDLVVSNLSLHWVNDLPGVFRQVQQVLKPDGLFLASMFGEATLWELRNAFLVGEQEREGGISNHVSPFAGVADIGDLLTRARFGLPTVDQESIVVDFKDPFVLMKELRLMGESNAQLSRRPYVPRDTFYAAAAAYKALYGKPNGGVPATFQIVYLIGWSPHPSQQQALSPGSAKASMKEFSQQVGEFKTL